MKFFSRGKDGGPDSTVTGYWLTEIKRLFSVALLRFGHGSRDEYHSHAFNSVSWLLSGMLEERMLDGRIVVHRPGIRPIVTRRDDFHRVVSDGTSWVFTLRGPWADRWFEYDPDEGWYTELRDGREIVSWSDMERSWKSHA